MAVDFAFITTGQSGLKVVAPLVAAAKQLGKECVVLCYQSRAGKSTDNLRVSHVSRLGGLGARCVMVADHAEAEQKLIQERPKHVVVQDAQWHFPFTVKGELRDKTSSISIFTDTMHWASGYFDAALVPAWTYFPDEQCRAKTEQLSKQKWPSSCLGSPMYDHVMWLDSDASLGQRSVLFMAPHPALLSSGQVKELRALEQHVGPDLFHVLQRPKHAHDFGFKARQLVLGEETVPYVSLAALAAADIHVNCFSISGFESRFLGRPMLNLHTTCGDGSLGNVKVRDYALDAVYDSDNRMTIREGQLIAMYEHLVDVRSPPVRVVTERDNHSLDILNHVLSR